MQIETNYEKSAVLILRLSVFFCFTGWAWQHIYWDVPYREILWNPEFFGGVVESWGVDWQHYVGNESTDGIIQLFIKQLGYLFIGFGIMALTVKKDSLGQIFGLLAGMFFLCLIAYCQYLDKMKYPAQFIEYGGQFLCPLILILALKFGIKHKATISVAVLAFVMIFFGHGLFALGVYPTPANFYEMTMNVLHVSEQGAEFIIRSAGFMDLLVCAALVVPMFRKPALIYATIWGFLTALARPWSGMSLNYEWWGADQYFHLFMLRFPHFLIPMFLILTLCRQSATESDLEIIETEAEAQLQ